MIPCNSLQFPLAIEPPQTAQQPKSPPPPFSLTPGVRVLHPRFICHEQFFGNHPLFRWALSSVCLRASLCSALPCPAQPLSHSLLPISFLSIISFCSLETRRNDQNKTLRSAAAALDLSSPLHHVLPTSLLGEFGPPFILQLINYFVYFSGLLRHRVPVT